MEARGTKMKSSENVHGDLGIALTKLNNDSGKLNSDMKAAKEDFALMCKSMTDRQAEILTSGLFVEEQHRRVLDLIDVKQDVVIGASSVVAETSRTPGIDYIRKLARESDESLRNDRIYRDIELQELEKTFKQYEGMLKENLADMRKRAEGIEKQRRELSTKLIKLARSAVEQTGAE